MNTYEDFTSKVGLIEDEDTLEKIGAPEGYEDNGMYQANYETANALFKFVKDFPQYHVVSSVEVDNADIYDVMVNRFAIVNRLGYWLADGSTDDTLEYVEYRHNTGE